MSSKHRRQIKRADAKGRTKGGDLFHVRLYDWMMQSAAWAALSAAERCVYVEIERRYFGDNNGHIGLGVRAVARPAGYPRTPRRRPFSG